VGHQKGDRGGVGKRSGQRGAIEGGDERGG